MPTFQITVTTGAGSNSGTLTYSGAEANRIFNSWKALDPRRQNATQQDFVNAMIADAKTLFVDWCRIAETTTPTPPVITEGP